MTESVISLSIAILFGLMHMTLVVLLIRKVLPNALPPIADHVVSAILLLILMLVVYSVAVPFNFYLAFSAFVFLIAAYLFIFGAVYKSLSLRFLLALKFEGGRASFSLLDDLVTTPSFVGRVELLCSMGLAEREGGSYQITPKGAVMARKILLLRRLFGISTTGLY